MKYQTINPYTEQIVDVIETASTEVLKQQLTHAHQAWFQWRSTSFEFRGNLMKRVAHLMESHVDELAQLASVEMGKPLREAKHEVMKCLTACEYYAVEAERILAPQVTKLDDGRTITQEYQPFGVVLGVFPWNFPYWQIIRSAIPVLMAGNTMLVKPAPNVSRCSVALHDLFIKAGIPEQVMQLVFADEQQVADLIADPRVKACTLTGSEKAGAAVASQAARHIKKSVLELGGSDPFLVLPDAPVKDAIEVAITSRFQNNGQSCIGAKRFIVHKEVSETFLSQLIQAASKLKSGDPLAAETQIGPLARKDLKEKLEAQVNDALQKGAICLWQQPSIPEKGYFFPVTILGGIKPGMLAYEEELFGPVISYYECDTIDDMVRLANSTSFGLGGSVWSADTNQALAIASQIESGQVFINSLVRSDTRFPFGGIKKSGYGRELGESGIKEFTYIKAIWC